MNPGSRRLWILRGDRDAEGEQEELAQCPVGKVYSDQEQKSGTCGETGFLIFDSSHYRKPLVVLKVDMTPSD